MIIFNAVQQYNQYFHNGDKREIFELLIDLEVIIKESKYLSAYIYQRKHKN